MPYRRDGHFYAVTGLFTLVAKHFYAMGAWLVFIGSHLGKTVEALPLRGLELGWALGGS